MHSSFVKNFFLIPLVLFFVIFSGCIFGDFLNPSDETDFSLNNITFFDNEGFPGVNISFSCSDKIFVEVYNPSNELVDTDFFYQNNNFGVLDLGGYRQTLESGNYNLKILDRDGKRLKTESLSLNQPVLSILSCDQKWIKTNEGQNNYILIGFELLVKNIGQVPVYPYELVVDYDSRSFKGVFMPSVINAAEIESIYCYVYETDLIDDASFSLLINDFYGDNIVSESFNFDIVDNVLTKDFNWRYKNVFFDIEVSDVDFLKNYYQNKQRIIDEDYRLYIYDVYDDIYIEHLSESLLEVCPYSSDVDTINFVASFVQNLEYKKDSDTDDSYEYPRYPVETLFNGMDGGGDCEDKAILTASILDYLGYDVALIRIPDHMAVGVGLTATAIPDKDFYVDDYYYLETTTPNHMCGTIPEGDQYDSPSELDVFAVDDEALLIHDWKNNSLTTYSSSTDGDFVKVELVVENLGPSRASNVFLNAIFVDENENIVKSETVEIDWIDGFMKKSRDITVDIPEGVKTKFITRVIYNGQIVDENEADNYI